jgi:ribosomal protein S18 acetylase RimI-like enzyme
MADFHGVDEETMRRLLIHEARIHAVPRRDLRDLGDAILLHDPIDPDPFWNRLEAIRWPADPAAFDRRLSESLIQFATLGRRPHIWPSPAFDAPGDLVARLVAHGFEDIGRGQLMLLTEPERAVAALEGSGGDRTAVTIERLHGLSGPAAARAARDIVEVLLDAFGVEPERGTAIERETAATLGHPDFSHYLIRFEGRPAAVARRGTFDDLTYLSSIGTAQWARGLGLGRLVTAAAAADGHAAGSHWTYLGVFAENATAVRLYERVGFAVLGGPVPDLLLVG